MPSTSTSADRTARTRRRRRSRDPMALKVLKADHRQVEAWFDEYEQLEDEGEKLALVQQILTALKVHTQIEEEIFYPAERGEIEDDILDEALVEHASAKQLIAELEAMSPDEDLFDAKVKVLGEYIKHHVKEEEGDMFRQAKRADLDLEAIGRTLAARKEELMARMSQAKAQ